LELKCGGLLFDRHEPPLTRRFVVYYCSALYRLFLNIARKGDEADPLARFLTDFSRHHWPSDVPVPEIWYDPRSLQPSPSSATAVLHAKCIVVDQSELLVSSANLTEAAYMRNIEVGVLIRSDHLARQLTHFFDGLIAGGHLRRASAGSTRR
jgi:phosphatidylserine/phosphatidylglycerophosphate/cardiolipin synthase-like enzyme